MVPSEQVAMLRVAVASATAGVVVDPMVRWAGVPIEVVLWAVAGAACALSFLPPMTRGRAVVALLVGAAIAVACTPLVMYAAGLPSQPFDKGVAALLGLGAQVVIAPLFGGAPQAVGELLRALVDRVRGR